MNKVCSIFVDNTENVDNKIISYLKTKYDTVFLCGTGMTTKFNSDIPYIYYNYLQYNPNIDILFQNIADINKIKINCINIGYIYNDNGHHHSYDLTHSSYAKIDFILSLNKKITKKLLSDIFSYTKELIHV